MQTMTSAYANKMLRSLEKDKIFWVNKEAASGTFICHGSKLLFQKNPVNMRVAGF